MRSRHTRIPSCVVAVMIALSAAASAAPLEPERDQMAMRLEPPPAELRETPKFVVLILACDARGACNEFRRPFDVDNEVACQLSSAMAMTRWMVENPGYSVRRFACAKAGETSL